MLDVDVIIEFVEAGITLPYEAGDVLLSYLYQRLGVDPFREVVSRDDCMVHPAFASREGSNQVQAPLCERPWATNWGEERWRSAECLRIVNICHIF